MLNWFEEFALWQNGYRGQAISVLSDIVVAISIIGGAVFAFNSALYARYKAKRQAALNRRAIAFLDIDTIASKGLDDFEPIFKIIKHGILTKSEVLDRFRKQRQKHSVGVDAIRAMNRLSDAIDEEFPTLKETT
jgi:hypothetical protein